MFTDINLPPRMPDEDNNFVGSLVGTSRATQELTEECSCCSKTTEKHNTQYTRTHLRVISDHFQNDPFKTPTN